MRKWMGSLLCVITALSMVIVTSCATIDSGISGYAEDGAQSENLPNSYSEDRAQIENLQARYMFALDFRDPDAYVSTFTEDGVLDIIGMKWEGRENIRQIFRAMSPELPEGEEKPAAEETEGPYPATGRHNITNIVLKIDGDKAVGRAYWFHYENDNPDRKAVLDSYGHYEDEMVKVNGEWLFSKRVIYNEQMAEWIGPTENPSW